MMNKAKAIRDIMNGTSCLNDIATFTAFMERFRNGPTRYDPPSQGQQQQRQSTPVEQPSTEIPRLKADDLKYDGTTQVTSYINRLECMVELYGEKQVLSLLPRAMKGAAQQWFDSLFASTRLAMNDSIDAWMKKLTDQFRTNASTAL